MPGVSRKDREPEPIQDWKVEVHPGPPDPPTSISRAVAGIEQIAQLEARVRELEAERAGWQQEWRAVLQGPVAKTESEWGTLAAARKQREVWLNAFGEFEDWLETRTVSPPRPVSEEE